MRGRNTYNDLKNTYTVKNKRVLYMWKMNKRKVLALIISILLCMQTVFVAQAEEEKQQAEPEVSAPSAILMEISTGQIIYDKNPDEKLPPASVTKVMTMLLIFDAIEAGKMKWEDSVTVSEYAASMGGSQVYLEPGETQTVDTMLKCIAVASANDACVAFHNRRHIKIFPDI